MEKMINIEYNSIISIENLLAGWKEFLPGKKNKEDVYKFSLNLIDNIVSLHNDLDLKTYRHGGYVAFKISDPKPRDIHKATVRDRLLHHAIYRILYPYFDKRFFSESYSCRLGKGTHRAINKFRELAIRESNNHTKTLWVLKCDVRKFFASINHNILLNILNKHIQDEHIVWLLERVIRSFNSGKENTGLPLGNLTSQLLVNIYMNEFDQFAKHRLKIKYYIRYADDFVILSKDKDYLLELIPKIGEYLDEHLKLSLHPDKVFIKTFASGMDFLGWVHFTKHRVLRTSTKRRAVNALNESENKNTLQSYCDLLKHGNQYLLRSKMQEKIEILKKREN